MPRIFNPSLSDYAIYNKPNEEVERSWGHTGTSRF